MTQIDKRHGPVVRIERLGQAELKLFLQQLLFVCDMVEAGQAYAQRINAAGQRLTKAINGVCVGDLRKVRTRC